MANTTFLDLPIATALDGTEVVPIVQPPNASAGVSKRVTVGQIASLAGIYNNTQAAESVFGNTSTSAGVGTSIVGAAGEVLRYSNAGQIGFGQVDLSTSVAVVGILPVSNGGIGTSALDAFALLLGNGTGALSEVAAATSGYVLTSNGTGSAPSYQLGGGLADQPGLSVFGITGNSTASLASITGTQDQVLRVDANGTTLTFGQVNLGTTAAVTSILTVSHGGSGTSTLTANGVLLGNGTGALAVAIVGTAGYLLASTGTATPPAFAKVDISSSIVSGILTIPFGGTGTSALTAFGVVLGNGTSAVTLATAGTAGQILTGQTATSQPVFITATGDFTFSAVGTGTIAANAVTFTKFQQMQALSVHGNSSSATTNSTAIVGTANQVLAVNSGGTSLGFQTLTTANFTGVTGTGSIVLSNTPTLVSPILGTATANGIVVTSGTSAGAFDVVNAGNTLIDSLSWGRSFARVGTNATTTVDQFGLAINLNVTGSTGAGVDYEKFAILAWGESNDPSTSHNLDIGGIDARGYIANTNATGRAWGGFFDARIVSGGTGDGLLFGIEVDSTNNGSDQATVGTTTSKYGIELVAAGANPSTCAILLTTAQTGSWHKGIYATVAALGTGTADSFLELAGKYKVSAQSGKLSVGWTTTLGSLSVHPATNENFYVDTNFSLGSGIAFGSINDANSAFQPMEFRATQIMLSDTVGVSIGTTAVLGANSIQAIGQQKILAGTAIPAGGTAGAGYMLSSVSNFGIFFGSGAPALTAGTGSIYLRSDGNTTTSRIYVNTNGSATWSALVTVS